MIMKKNIFITLIALITSACAPLYSAEKSSSPSTKKPTIKAIIIDDCQEKKGSRESEQNEGYLTPHYNHTNSNGNRNGNSSKRLPRKQSSFNSNLFNNGTPTPTQENNHVSRSHSESAFTFGSVSEANEEQISAPTRNIIAPENSSGRTQLAPIPIEKRVIIKEVTNQQVENQHPHFVQQTELKGQVEITELPTLSQRNLMDEIAQEEALRKAKEMYDREAKQILENESKSRESVVQAFKKRNMQQNEQAITQALKDFILTQLKKAYLKAYSKIPTTNNRDETAAIEAQTSYTLYKAHEMHLEQKKEQEQNQAKELQDKSCCIIL